MKISTKSRYGVKAMIELAKAYGITDTISLSYIAEQAGLSESYLEQLFIPLRKSGLIISTRGAQGGYTLQRAPQLISIGDIMRALEDGLILVDCLDSETYCEKQCQCNTYGIWKKLSDSINAQLDAIKLSDCLEDNQ